MKFSRLSGTLCVLVLAPVMGHAQVPPAPRDPNDQLIREQQEKLREDLLRQAPSASIQFDQPGQDGRVPDARALSDIPSTGPTFLVHTIRQEGAALLPEAVFREVAAPFAGQSLGVAHINVLLERMNRALVAAGYTTSRAYVGNQSLHEGVLAITIVPGTIEKLLYNGAAVEAGRADGPGIAMAMPMEEGDVLRLRDIEQAVDQLNRLRRNNVQVQIRPGTQPGGSIVEFVNQPRDGARYNVSVDNQGSAATGRMRIQMGVDNGNVLGLMESLNAGLTTSADTNALYGTFSVPLGYTTVAGMASISEYQNLVGDTALVYGRSRSYTLSVNHLLDRDQTSKTAFDVSLTRRDSERSINNLRLSPQDQTVLRAGVNRLQRFETEYGMGQWTADAGVSHGLSWWGANRDPADLPSAAARYAFTKAELSASLERPLPGAWVWRSRGAGQWSRHPLYSSEQLFAGGVGSVRGFAESAQGGDRGAYWRNEWAWQKAPPLFGGEVRYEPYTFFDMAHVRTVSDGRSHGLASAGGGVRMAYRTGFFEAILGKPLRRPQGVADSGWRINVSASYQF
ncbi:ShlB/FhaC/HecB family hemolysin secretion/activation protein [Paracidovorax valerianellae]|uniref:ShlB/FhaC/HecB family hemolysin secretion/activation protein n=1 Tax=Paracidovorax valerianellae TaxID=187868 RepID=UPI002302ED06|nr:ShlB/FhaC/HecB family hemolysin secretion/activation protein [Paracidovorax valerianellae]MDA8443617.1 ShlB/FhaC/HecB family hemolysin secretion/activation protein [Paracidovorax valerianellae]